MLACDDIMPTGWTGWVKGLSGYILPRSGV